MLAGLVATGLAALMFATVGAVPATAAPATPAFGPKIDAYAKLDQFKKCDPTDKPGVVDFRNLLNRTYGTHSSGISRACGPTAQEHQEGRALDYFLAANNATQRAQGQNLINWLFATDQYGNKHAMARRLGIMYIIWNRQIWGAYRASEGWRPYKCNGTPTDCHINHIHFSFSWAGARRQTTWWTARRGATGTASVYGVRSDGRLTYTAIDAATGNRTHGAVASGARLGFTAKAIATLNFNTVLITSTSGTLYRIDIVTNNTTVNFKPPVAIGTGWSHDRLAFDGTYLYGIAGRALRRYQVTSAKPARANLVGNTLIGTGFTLKTLTATGPGWILGTTSDGKLLSYRIRGAGSWSRYELKPSGWQGFTHLLSPGGGVYYGQTTTGRLDRYLDTSPFDGSGADLTGFANDPVDTSGWSQVLLSAQPATVS